VRFKTIRIGDGTTTARGDARADLTNAWTRYLSIPATSKTSKTSATRTPRRSSPPPPIRTSDGVRGPTVGP
jgi:hypothetical protein